MLKLTTKTTTHKLPAYHGAIFEVVPVTKSRRQEIIDENTVPVATYPNGEDEPAVFVERPDWMKIMSTLLVEQVVGWSGIEGNPPCNDENKMDVADRQENAHICDYINEHTRDIGKAVEEIKEKETKN